MSVSSLFHRSVVWTQICNMNTRYTIYETKELKKSKDASKHLTIIVIPGNPGNDRFYDEFCGKLMEQMINCGRDSRIISISHSNHVLIDDDFKKDYTISKGIDYETIKKQNGIIYNLDDQIRHKINFCRDVLDKDNIGKVYLLGHSIGALISLKMLNGLREFGWENVTKCFALFPTVEKMSKTPQGVRLHSLLRFFDYFNFLTCIIMFFLELLPYNLKHKICTKFLNNSLVQNSSVNILKENVVPKCIVDSSLELIRASVVKNIVHMSNHELNTVCDFDELLLLDAQKNNTSITFFYGIDDQWSPVQFATEMTKRVIKLNYNSENKIFHKILIDENRIFEHAFVIRGSNEMAIKLCSLFCK